MKPLRARRGDRQARILLAVGLGLPGLEGLLGPARAIPLGLAVPCTALAAALVWLAFRAQARISDEGMVHHGWPWHHARLISWSEVIAASRPAEDQLGLLLRDGSRVDVYLDPPDMNDVLEQLSRKTKPLFPPPPPPHQ